MAPTYLPDATYDALVAALASPTSTTPFSSAEDRVKDALCDSSIWPESISSDPEAELSDAHRIAAALTGLIADLAIDTKMRLSDTQRKRLLELSDRALRTIPAFILERDLSAA